MNLDIAPKKVRLWFDQRIVFPDNLAITHHDQGQRTGTVGFCIRRLKIHRDKIHFNAPFTTLLKEIYHDFPGKGRQISQALPKLKFFDTKSPHQKW